jgi:hypothetical protein
MRTQWVTDLAEVVAGDHLRADAGRYLGYAVLALLAALAVVRLVRPPRGVSPGQRSPLLGLIRYFSPVACLP